MHVIDIIILVLIGIGVIQGLMKGSIKQLAQIVGFVAGLLLARGLFSTVAEQLAPALGTSITIAQILSFILIWVAVPIGCSLIASVLTKALDVINLGWLNRLAGAMLGPLVQGTGRQVPLQPMRISYQSFQLREALHFLSQPARPRRANVPWLPGRQQQPSFRPQG